MTLFGNLTNDGLEESQDRLGGREVFDTNVYDLTVKAMYAGQSDHGAHSVTVVGMIAGKEYKETIYITNRKGENFFLNKQDKTKKVPLPGFTTIDELCLILTGSPLSEQATEEKIVNIYNKAEGKELPTAVPMLMDCLGKEAKVAIVATLENKSKSDGNGGYTPIADEQTVNNIDKVFHPTLLVTVPEARRDAALAGEGKEALGAGFHEKWVKRNAGKTRDKRTFKDGADVKSGRPGRSSTPPQAGEQKKAPSLFG